MLVLATWIVFFRISPSIALFPVTSAPPTVYPTSRDPIISSSVWPLCPIANLNPHCCDHTLSVFSLYQVSNLTNIAFFVISESSYTPRSSPIFHSFFIIWCHSENLPIQRYLNYSVWFFSLLSNNEKLCVIQEHVLDDCSVQLLSLLYSQELTAYNWLHPAQSTCKLST